MSDADILRLIEEMENRLSEQMPEDDPDAIADWHRRFLAAMATAERGGHWPDIVQRSHAVAGRIEGLVSELEVRKESLRKEMETHATGRRALKAYKPA